MCGARQKILVICLGVILGGVIYGNCVNNLDMLHCFSLAIMNLLSMTLRNIPQDLNIQELNQCLSKYEKSQLALVIYRTQSNNN